MLYRIVPACNSPATHVTPRDVHMTRVNQLSTLCSPILCSNTPIANETYIHIPPVTTAKVPKSSLSPADRALDCQFQFTVHNDVPYTGHCRLLSYHSWKSHQLQYTAFYECTHTDTRTHVHIHTCAHANPCSTSPTHPHTHAHTHLHTIYFILMFSLGSSFQSWSSSSSKHIKGNIIS